MADRLNADEQLQSSKQRIKAEEVPLLDWLTDSVIDWFSD
jgi:hypothetical protein